MKKKLSHLFFLTFLFSGVSIAQLAGSGKAYDFTSSYISVPNSSTLSPATAITLEAWVKADSYSANSWENVIISKDGWATGNQGYTLRTGANGVLSFNFSSAGVWKEVTTSAIMSTGNWYHVAGTYDGTTLRIFINGIEQNTLAFSGPITNGTYDVTIGKMAYLAGGTRYFDGMIDEVRIWSSAVPQTSLREYMCKKVSTSHPQYASLAGYWNMDQTGAVTDQSVNGNNGTSVGGTQVSSGAAIGDESIYSYSAIPSLSLPFGSIDTAKVSGTTILPLIQLYRVDAPPLVTTAASSIDSLDQTHYYGVYVSPTPASSYDFTYHYGVNALAAGANELYTKLGIRSTGSSIPWAVATITQNSTLNTMSYSATGRKEMILVINCAPVNITPSNVQNLCEGDSVLLQANPAVGIIQWYDGTAPIPGATSPTLNIMTSGVYYYTGNTGICAASSQNVTVNINPIPTVEFGDLPSSVFCVTDGLQNITNMVPAIGGTFSGPGVFNSTFTPNMAPAGVHTLYYNFTDQFGCHDIDSFTVTLGTPPPTPVITMTTGTTLCVPTCGTYTWTMGGTIIPNATDSCYTATANGIYNVTCSTPEGCSATSANFTVAGVGINESIWAKGLEISPNPTQNTINIQITHSTTESLFYSITDINGRLILKERLDSHSSIVDFSQWEKGVYLITLSNGQDQVVKRIIKE